MQRLTECHTRECFGPAVTMCGSCDREYCSKCETYKLQKVYAFGNYDGKKTSPLCLSCRATGNYKFT